MIAAQQETDPTTGLIRPPVKKAIPDQEPIPGSTAPAGAGSTAPITQGGFSPLEFAGPVTRYDPVLQGAQPGVDWMTGQPGPSIGWEGAGPAPLTMPGSSSPPSNLGGTAILPGQSTPLSGSAEEWRKKFGSEFTPQDITPEALGGNRREMLNQLLADFDTQAAERDSNAMTQVGRRDAALGRLGSGMTSGALGTIARQSARDKGIFRNQLAADTIDKEFSDRFADRGFKYGVNRDNQNARTAAQEMAYRFGNDRATMDYGQGQDARNEFRNERGYQDSREAYSTDRAVQAAELQDKLTGSAFDRAQQRLITGRQGSPAGAYAGAASDLSGQSDQTMQALMMYLKSLGIGS